MTFAVCTWVGGTTLTTVGAGAAAGGAGATILGGALVGAGVGQLVGGNTKSTLMGAGIGAGAGLAGGAMGFGQAAGAGVGGATTAAPMSLEGAYGALTAEGAVTMGTAGGATGLTTGAVAGGTTTGMFSSGLANAMLIGQVGMGLLSAFSGSGQSFQDKIELSPQGKNLMYGAAGTGGYVNTVKTQAKSAFAGETPQKAADDINKLKIAEANRNKRSQDVFQATGAEIANQDPSRRGTGAIGGNMVKGAIVDSNERMQGLYAPSSVLNAYTREELMNSIGNISNVQNLENQTAMVNYSGALSKWQTNRMLDTQKGAALGNVASMAGGFMLNNAYMNRMTTASRLA